MCSGHESKTGVVTDCPSCVAFGQLNCQRIFAFLFFIKANLDCNTNATYGQWFRCHLYVLFTSCVFL